METGEPVPGISESRLWERSVRIGHVAPFALALPVLLAGAALFAWLGCGESDFVWAALACTVSFGGLLVLVRWLWTRTLPFARAVRERRDEITWMYAERRRNESWVAIGLADGSMFALAVPGDDASKRALQALSAHAPAATVGLSPELRAMFVRDPAALRRTRG